MKTKLQSSLKEALKAKDKLRLETIRLCLSAIQYEEMQKGVDALPDTAVVEILQREIKKRKEELEFAEKAGRGEMKEKLDAETAIIETFLPRQLSEGDLEKIIGDFRAQDPAANMGVVMKHLKDSYAGQYDGKIASAVVKRVLG